MSRIGVIIDGHPFEVELPLEAAGAGELLARINNELVPVTIPKQATSAGQPAWITISGRPYELLFDPNFKWVLVAGRRHHLSMRDLEVAATHPRGGDTRVRAPIPGRIARVLVAEGDRVEIGQPLLVLEAMKMENLIGATRAGVVNTLCVREGQDVPLDHLLAVID